MSRFPSLRFRFRSGFSKFQTIPWELRFGKYCVWLQPNAQGRVKFRARPIGFLDAEGAGCTAKREEIKKAHVAYIGWGGGWVEWGA